MSAREDEIARVKDIVHAACMSNLRWSMPDHIASKFADDISRGVALILTTGKGYEPAAKPPRTSR